ncbi:MAG: HD domain-containing phosphohydrolase [Pseudomonadota bacterium]
MSDCIMLTMDQLKVGLYIYLDMKWFDQPFAFNHFRIKNEEQIAVIRTLGLTQIRYSPSLSSAEPAPPAAQAPDVPVAAPAPAIAAAVAAKNAMIARIEQLRAASARISEAFSATAKTIRSIDQNLFARPQESVQQAGELIDQIAAAILSDRELAIHVMGDTPGGEELYFHSLNVTVLAMMLGRDIALPTPVVHALGMGALFHDVGKREIPERLFREAVTLTQAERTLCELHPTYGLEIGRRLKLPAASHAIISEHHEHNDGSGYPGKLKGEAIGLLSRIVAIANCYDNLCNPVNLADALTPHETLALMFAKMSHRFDPKILQRFIRCLGIYPPGTLVELSNGAIGITTTVNTSKPMKPMIMVYNADVPKAEAILVDMEDDSDISIARALRPSQVPPDVYQYLNPRKRVSYYFDTGKTPPRS